METYEPLEIEVVEFDAEDVIVTSGCDDETPPLCVSGDSSGDQQ